MNLNGHCAEACYYGLRSFKDPIGFWQHRDFHRIGSRREKTAIGRGS